MVETLQKSTWFSFGKHHRQKSIADYVCSRKMVDHQSENTTTFLLVVIPSVWLSKIRPQEMPSSPVRWSISLLKVSSLHLKPLGCLAAPAAIVPIRPEWSGWKLEQVSQSSEDDQRCIQRLIHLLGWWIWVSFRLSSEPKPIIIWWCAKLRIVEYQTYSRTI